MSAQPSEAAGRYAWFAGLVLAAFVVGLAALLMLRFERGDVYPAYSSLRSDPLGTRALFESLNAMAPDTARRWHQPPDQVELNPGTTLLICGLNPHRIETRSRTWKKLMDRLASDGGRIVITFGDRADSDRDSDETDTDTQEENESADDKAIVSPDDDNPENTCPAVEASECWDASENLGVHVAAARRSGPDPVASLMSIPPANGLPDRLPWHGAQFFRTEDEAWQHLYSIDREDQPVVVWRAWGQGELVLAADSFLLSNEALRTARSAPLLAWLLPPDRLVWFDEFHHGIARHKGIATLARKYGLERIFGALVFVGLLFVWRLSTTFVPPVTEPEPGDAIAGGDSGQGLVSLMQQHLPAKQLISICFDTWQACPAGRHVSPERLAMVRKWLKEHGTTNRNPVAAYQHIAKLLKQRRLL